MSDRRRILGPADAKIPTVGISSAKNDTSAQKPAEDTPRSEDGIRKFFLKTGLTKNANGLAYLEVGDTILEVSVYGPRPIRGSFIDRASFSVECKFLPYLTQPNEVIFNQGGQQNGRTNLTHIEHKISSYVETALLPAILVEKYPKSTIDIFVNVISFNPNTLNLLNLINWVVNCSSLAMVDSGIEVRDLVTSGHVKLKGDSTMVDPQITSEADISAGVECVASYMTMQNHQLVAFWIDSKENEELSNKKLEEMISACQNMSSAVRKSVNAYLLEHC